MSAVLPYENWPSVGGPKSLAYFCGCLQVSLTDPINGPALLQLTAAQGQTWLQTYIARLWPNAPPAQTWWMGGTAIARYDRANTTLPNSTCRRRTAGT